jgi:hypothetical protein
MNASEPQEVLGPRLAKGEARPLETRPSATTASPDATSPDSPPTSDVCKTAKRTSPAGSGAYAEHTFDGLSAANAKKISVQDAVLLALEQHGRISLVEQTSQLPGATGLRALSIVMSQHGEDTMLVIYGKAVQLRPGRTVVDSTVNLAVHGLLAPPPAACPVA